MPISFRAPFTVIRIQIGTSPVVYPIGFFRKKRSAKLFSIITMFLRLQISVCSPSQTRCLAAKHLNSQSVRRFLVRKSAKIFYAPNLAPELCANLKVLIQVENEKSPEINGFRAFNIF